MRSQFVPSTAQRRRGITLMEVLISIGILAIGLTSVVAILPAGQKQATKAIIYDRASLVAANALADAVTSGVCKENALDSNAPLVAVDPVGAWPTSISLPTPLPTQGWWRNTGVFAAATATSNAASGYGLLAAQARDDLEVAAANNDDDPPLYLEIDGARAFTGRFSSALLRTSLDGNSLAAGDMARLAVVVFYNREAAAADAFVTASLASGLLTVTPPAGKTLADIVRPGTVIYKSVGANGERLHQITSVAVSSPTTAFITHTGADLGAGPTTVAILLDSVGLAERIVTIEGTEEFSR
jgi:type II secretory pathway pseudopilin PulG